MNYYEILEVCPTATPQEIKQSYRRLAKQFHPDSQHQLGNHNSIVEINRAYEILGDSQQRNRYDQQLAGKHDLSKRERRHTNAQAHHQHRRQTARAMEISLQQWIKTIYLPLNRLFFNIINLLPEQLNSLSADPFDEDLMANFENYLEDCRQNLEKAHSIFSSQPNPTEVAKVAMLLYYSLNHLDDALEEFGRFTDCYDEHYLNTGKELFRLAKQLLQEAKLIAQYF